MREGDGVVETEGREGGREGGRESGGEGTGRRRCSSFCVLTSSSLSSLCGLVVVLAFRVLVVVLSLLALWVPRLRLVSVRVRCSW